MISLGRSSLTAKRLYQFLNVRRGAELKPFIFHIFGNYSQTSILFTLRSKFHSIPKNNTAKEQSIHADFDHQVSSKANGNEPIETPRDEYELTFTCQPCGARSTHRISKQGYHHGSVLVSCPNCKNRHVISDQLKIFGDKITNIEDLLREQGHYVQKGTLSEDGAFELWADGNRNKRTAK
ncbi:putative dnl zinc finger domain-containing protein [Erysiphe necator]|uniref:Putative dnl zinc finger domain-containing protein n=1 Tax=Uncinula necator TaxID=52586 RepID=A0A0B1PAT0_UNCNE|nr:putative dnl zinc finger domain-containing protein [Erysiphe necator]